MRGHLNLYRYLGRNIKGKLVRGNITGHNIFDVIGKIRQAGVSPVAVDRKGRFFDLTIRGRKTTASDIILFCRQLSSLVKKSLPLSESIILIAADMERFELKEALLEISKSVESGEKFSVAVSRYPNIFPDVLIHLVTSGEQNNDLALSLDTTAELLETEEALHNKLKANILYPLGFIFFTAIVCLAVYFFIFTRLMPILRMTLTGVEEEDVEVSKTLFHSGILGKPFIFWVSIILVGIILVGVIVHFLTRRKRLFQRVLSHLPPIGAVRNQALVIGFLRVMKNMLKAGMPLDTAFKHAGTFLDDRKQKVKTATEILASGQKASQAFESLKIFSASELWLIAAGEKTSNFEDALENIICFRGTELETRIGIFISVIQPFLIFLGGLYVCFVWRTFFGFYVSFAKDIISRM